MSDSDVILIAMIILAGVLGYMIAIENCENSTNELNRLRIEYNQLNDSYNQILQENSALIIENKQLNPWALFSN